MKLKLSPQFLVLFLWLLLVAQISHAQTTQLRAIWVLRALTSGNQEIALVTRQPAAKKLSVEMSFTADSFNIHGGCNFLSGKYRLLKNSKLKFSSGRSTMMYCSDGTIAIDQSLTAALLKTTVYQIKNKVLTLRDSSGQNILIFDYVSPNNPPKKPAAPRQKLSFIQGD